MNQTLDLDISKLKVDNKMFNTKFLLKESIFYTLAKFTNCYTDKSIAYIPYIDRCATIRISENEERDVCFFPPERDNNYADLTFENNLHYYNIKACRVKSLNAICIDGGLLTYEKGSVTNDNFFVFYSMNPNETDKVLVISASTYEFLTRLNYEQRIHYLNINDVERIRDGFHFRESQFSVIDLNQNVEKIGLEECELKNCDKKLTACLVSLSYIQKNKTRNTKTHFGKQYSAFNLITGEIRHFRDCIARNNFFNSLGIKLAKNSNVNRNCHNMTKIVNDETVDTYRINLLDESGWIICNYIPNTAKLMSYIQTLILKLKEKSKQIYKRLKNIFAKTKQTFILLCNIIKQKTIKMFDKLKDKLTYFRPYSFLSYITSAYKIDINHYLNEHPSLKKYM